MSMEARMTDSTAGNQTKIAWPRLTRHTNKHTETKLTQAQRWGLASTTKRKADKTEKIGSWFKCSAFKGMQEVKALTSEHQDVYHK